MVTILNVCVMIFVIIAGGYLGFKTGWVGYSVPKGYIVSSFYSDFYPVIVNQLIQHMFLCVDISHMV